MLKGKTAVVTGGTRGIGLAISLKLAQHGANIVLNGVHKESLETTGEKIKALGVGYECVAGDVSLPETGVQLLKTVEAAFGKVDILVNNAGINLRVPFMELEAEQWLKLINVNLNGTFYVTHSLLPLMIKGANASVVNISSSAAKTPHANAAAGYAASKGGVNGLTRQLAYELAQYGIRVNAICPGPIETDMTAQWPEGYLDKVLNKIPLRRLGRVEDVANAVLFLASDASAFITGESINVNGGAYMD